jgi:formamidopyrimidine-DNA glycosylase
MIELPEAITISKQMAAALTGLTITDAVAGSSPHKFAFYTSDPLEYAQRLRGLTLGEARPNGNMILIPAGPELTLVLGEGGERIFLHRPGVVPPVKHQLWLAFDDSSYLTVSIQGWGFVGLMDAPTLAAHPYAGRSLPFPLSEGYTKEAFQALFEGLPAGDPRSIKQFIVSDPRVCGVGNGCLQDILFRAHVHPRSRALELAPEQQVALYHAVRDTLSEMVANGGRDSELDLFGQPGGYRRILHSKVVGHPCPICGTPIEKQSFLGGSVYFCPVCQPEPPPRTA